MKTLLLLFIYIYQKIISPILPARCRFYPTCSCYAKTALRRYRWHYALYLIIKRLSRCQPFGGSGVDFVPLNLSQFTYHIPIKHFSYIYNNRFIYRYVWTMA